MLSFIQLIHQNVINENDYRFFSSKTWTPNSSNPSNRLENLLILKSLLGTHNDCNECGKEVFRILFALTRMIWSSYMYSFHLTILILLVFLCTFPLDLVCFCMILGFIIERSWLRKIWIQIKILNDLEWFKFGLEDLMRWSPNFLLKVDSVRCRSWHSS